VHIHIYSTAIHICSLAIMSSHAARAKPNFARLDSNPDSGLRVINKRCES
jgi:hypothetical protein